MPPGCIETLSASLSRQLTVDYDYVWFVPSGAVREDLRQATLVSLPIQNWQARSSAAGAAITRGGARPDDDLWVSGAPGRAALGLAHLRGDTHLADTYRDDCLAALHRPQPRVALGLGLRGIASAMLDVSDGLLGDLDHILESSCVGAVIDEANLPLAPLVAACGDPARAFAACTGGGDDYELLFTAPPTQRAALADLSARLALPLHRIGSITPATRGLHLRDTGGTLRELAARGYDHFGNGA